MKRLFDKWVRKTSEPSETKTPVSAEWATLENAVRQRNFTTIFPALRAWCMLTERSWEYLQAVARTAEFSDVALNKLQILFLYLSGDTSQAFDAAQLHFKRHGFDPDLFVICLVAVYQSEQFEMALEYLQEHGEQQMKESTRADYWRMVSVIYWSTNTMHLLEHAVDRTVELAPDEVSVLQTALGVYIELGNQNKIADVRARLDAIANVTGFAYALSLLALGELETGWRHMESRYDVADALRLINQGLKQKPRWSGEPIGNRRLLISAEQGLGDTVQMARYLPMLKELCSTQIALEVQPEAISLLQHNYPECVFVERKLNEAPDVEFDCWAGMMSLPYLLRLWGKNTPGRHGYLQVPPDNLQYWKERAAQMSAGKEPRIGLAWSGQPAHRADRRRSIPFPLMMAQVKEIDACFFALQTQVPHGLPPNVIDVTEEMISLADTAALIEQMDLVITVDTSIVHIAGALGKKTWLLLPKRYEWRWGLEGESNDWYDSVTVIRQTEHANWQSVLSDVFERRLPELFNL
ncbi:MAG: hypothetical protein IPN06_19040 [Burkholderiales bacterium]|nr:hypothetical protein [Burkholderiales bacterium]